MDGTWLHGLALAVAVLNIGALAVVYYLSRAGKVREFESRVYGQLTNAASRIERMEASWLEEKTHLTALSDEMVTTADRTAKERKRLAAQERRDLDRQEPQPGQPFANGGDISALPREEQLRAVRAALRGG